MELEQAARLLVTKLCAGTPLAGWQVRIEVGHIVDPEECAATMRFIEPEEQRAVMRVEPTWDQSTSLTFAELVAHELGHLLTSDMMEFLPESPQRTSVEERLATRFGALLRSKAGGT